MKNLKFSLFLTFGLAAWTAQGQNLRFMPEKPLAGETMTVEYAVAKSPFAKEKDVYITAYSIIADKIKAMDVDLSGQSGMLKGTIAVPADAKAMYFVVGSSGSEAKDNNDDKGWGTPVYQSDRKTPVAGYALTEAAIYSRHSYYLQTKRNDSESSRIFSEHFKELTANESLLNMFGVQAVRTKNASAIAQLKAYAQEVLAKPKATEDELASALALSQTMEDETLAKALTEKLKKKYPKGFIVWGEKSKPFYEGSPTLDQRKAIVDELAKLPLPKKESAAQTLSSMANRVASLCLRAKDYAGFEKYSALVTNRIDRAMMYNSLAWPETGESIDAPAGNLELAKKYSGGSLQLLKQVMQGPTEQEKYPELSPKRMNEMLESWYAMFGDTYALILYKEGQAEEALKYQQLACEQRQFKDPETNERYCVYLEKVKGADMAEKKLEDLIAGGYASPAMKDQFKRLFMANAPEEMAAKYLGMLEKESRMRIKEETKKKMIDEPAPTFTLRNLKGETVSLESLKGKVVVVDFWATWCGPCISSFPGMQRAQNAHQDRGDVVFLFVDTWENGTEKEKNAQAFIDKNKYTFNVLMDNDNEVVGKYKVEGIPTKFIIGRDGHIRFKSVGYSGNEDALVDEMSFMIELAGEGAVDGGRMEGGR